MPSLSEPVIRLAKPSDVDRIHQLICQLAVYEKEPDAVTATAADIHESLFAPEAVTSCFVAEIAGEVVGIAIWFLNYSTWLGKPGIYLEDLFVQPNYRGRGIGFALLKRLASECNDRGYQRLDWAVLNWNQPAIDFYQAIGAKPQADWTGYRLTGPALTDFSNKLDS